MPEHLAKMAFSGGFFLSLLSVTVRNKCFKWFCNNHLESCFSMYVVLHVSSFPESLHLRRHEVPFMVPLDNISGWNELKWSFNSNSLHCIICGCMQSAALSSDQSQTLLPKHAMFEVQTLFCLLGMFQFKCFYPHFFLLCLRKSLMDVVKIKNRNRNIAKKSKKGMDVNWIHLYVICICFQAFMSSSHSPLKCFHFTRDQNLKTINSRVSGMYIPTMSPVPVQTEPSLGLNTWQTNACVRLVYKLISVLAHWGQIFALFHNEGQLNWSDW